MTLRISIFAVLVLSAGCTAEPPEPRGSWIEVIGTPELRPFGRLPERQPGFVSAEVLPDRILYTFDASRGPGTVEPMTVIGGDTAGGYVRRVLDVRPLPDGRLEVLTEPGHLGDLYRELHLVLHYRPRHNEEFRSRGLQTPRGIGAARAALDSCEDSAPCSVTDGASVSISDDGVGASVSGSASIEPFVEPTFDADFSLDIDAGNIGECALGGFGLWGDCPSPLEEALLTVDGGLTAGFRLTAGGAASLSGTVDLAGDLPTFTLFSATGPLGIGALTVEASPIVEGSLSIEADVGELTATAQVAMNAHLELGYTDGSWGASFEPTLTPFAGVTTTRAGGLRASASVRVGVQLSVKVAGLAGPYVKLTTGLTGEFGVQPHGCTWDASVSVAAQAEFGGELEIPVIDVEVASVEIAAIEVSADLWSTSGGVPWCSGASTCTGMATCHDEVFDSSVCEGSSGFQ